MKLLSIGCNYYQNESNVPGVCNSTKIFCVFITLWDDDGIEYMNDISVWPHNNEILMLQQCKNIIDNLEFDDVDDKGFYKRCRDLGVI